MKLWHRRRDRDGAPANGRPLRGRIVIALEKALDVRAPLRAVFDACGRGPGDALAPAEARRALLDEGANAFRGVLGVEADVLREGLELERLAQVALRVVVDRALGEADRDGRPVGDLARERDCGGHQLL